MQMMGCTEKDSLFVGDQLFTDILCGNLCGCVTILVEPYAEEGYGLYRIKRPLEKPLLHLYHSCKRRNAGNSESFTAMGYKSTPQIPEYLEKMGLNAYEYQCGRGVRINRESVLKLKAGCEARDIQLSLHAPYYISLSSVEEEKRQNSIKYILESAEAADLMGARRIVVHSGS